MSKTVVIRRQGAVSTSQRGALVTPTDLSRTATQDISGAMNAILADVSALYLKTKSFHWRLSGPHFRDYHLLFDEPLWSLRHARGAARGQ